MAWRLKVDSLVRWELSKGTLGKTPKEKRLNSFLSHLPQMFLFCVAHPWQHRHSQFTEGQTAVQSSQSYWITSDRFWLKLQKPFPLSCAVAACKSAVLPEEGSLVWSLKWNTYWFPDICYNKENPGDDNEPCFVAWLLCFVSQEFHKNHHPKTSCHMSCGWFNITS